ncbi:hypothetical protein ACOR62_06105 [Neisseria lisongii]|uniref:DUF2867 domain-containing protein n=1 Tax=Neisseria lisongii TaxID=2912188 RepID=A0AAW5ABY7_9NEIS|nr:hypothetical protein [Neisseria lisongii]MCF7528809.1 hypothetical protein [Neisseria lisongii]
MMKNSFLQNQWPFLKNLYGENIFDEYVFYIEDVYFQKWVNPLRIHGYIINIVVRIETPPTNILKNWDNAQGVILTLAFDGDFGLGHFTFQNRRLFNLIGKYCKFKFKSVSENYYESNINSEGESYHFIFKRLNIMFIRAIYQQASSAYCKKLSRN